MVQQLDSYVLDHRPAAITGPQVCRALRRTDANTPIMFFAGEAHGQQRQEAMLAGADATWSSREKLTATVQRGY